MPQLIIRGLGKTEVQQISKLLVDELTVVIGCPRDYFTIEVPVTTFIYNGEEVTATPLIQVNWFDRGQSVQDQAAAAIDRHIRALGYNQIEIFFIALQEAAYYENGKHY